MHVYQDWYCWFGWYLLVIRRTGSGSGNPGKQCNHRTDMGRLGSVIVAFPVSGHPLVEVPVWTATPQMDLGRNRDFLATAQEGASADRDSTAVKP